ncbi:hypothetical protein OV208_09310 [Corallococcus sp. bb12-1]|uniref:SitA5 family polymorphic toxin n=1 Tax=Corallococcus sp. bb12-1 TaxID=2996784 RepID=UPI00226EB148|nr:hypothetical protein [Corallococcus sp. bb12-1]MCY1041511.1 hypothetical protein [Corallococcus sp. bb12-1]
MALLLLLLAGCSATRAVHLDTGHGAPIVFTPRSRAMPVELDKDDFVAALTALGRTVRTSTRPQEAARQMLEVEQRSGDYILEPHLRRITPLGPGEHLEGEPPGTHVELTRAYLRWCERTARPGDCLRLLVEGPTVTGDGRYALAMAMAQGVVLEEMMGAFKDMADPQAMLATVLWTWTTYMILLAVPEPFTKGIAAVMTLTLIAYVGVDTFKSLIVGFNRLVEAADRATTFNELREAGERYGKVMGRNAARAFVMLATAAIGNTSAGLATKVPLLPGATRAAVQAEAQTGTRLAAVSGVGSVAMSTETLTIALAPGVVAMTAHGHGGDSAPKQAIVIPTGRTKHIFRDAPGHLQDTPTHRRWLQELAEDESARLGADRFGNSWFARLNPDGTQLWVQVRGREIINGGLNQVARDYNSQMGLSAPARP